MYKVYTMANSYSETIIVENYTCIADNLRILLKLINYYNFISLLIMLVSKIGLTFLYIYVHSSSL